MRARGKKVGFLGGTFDPIHLGHLNLIVQMLETQGLDEIYVCPAALSPHKCESPPPVAKEHRKAMVRLALEGLPQVRLVELELDREGPSYTVDTIRHLMAEERGAEFRLIVGADMLEKLYLWREVETLLKLAPPLIVSRVCQINILNHLFSAEMIEAIKKGMVSIPVMEISSTEVRQRLCQKKYCSHLVLAKVLDYISSHHLYY